MLLDVWYEGLSHIPRTPGCDVVLESARGEGRLTSVPEVGMLYLRLRSPHDAHHIGFVTDVSRWNTEHVLGTISGNTSRDGTSSNGDGVYEHDITVSDPANTIIFVDHRPELLPSR